MKTRLLLATGAVLLLAGIANAAPQWLTVTSQAGRMSFQMPGKPKATVSTTKTWAGPLDLYRYNLVDRTGPVIYSALYSDLPDKAAKLLTPDARIDGGRDSEMKTLGGKVIKEQEILFQGCTGRDITVKLPKGWTAYYRLVVSGKRLHQVVAATPTAKGKSPGIQRFLDSLTLLQ